MQAGLTREILAERAGLGVATLAALEGGQRRRPYPNTVVALAEALGVATALASAYADGVVFVDLAPLCDQRLVPATIAHALDVRESPGRSARDLLLAHLQDQAVLLVLDNFEHLLGAAALVAELLNRCPRVAVLATSRAALRVRAERRLVVPPLATPAADARDVAAIASAPAVRLFVSHAQAVSPRFSLDANNAPFVADICRHLEGIPLALELAAARTRLLSPQALLSRLEHRFPLLTGGATDLPERQQTLRRTLAWSYDLLGPAEQTLLRRVAVFRGGWTLEGLEAVCAGDDLTGEAVLESFELLLDNSLAHEAEALGEPRFSMLETVREFAHEHLVASGESTSIEAAHARYMVGFVEDIAPRLSGPQQVLWTARMLAEHDNVRAAFQSLIEAGDYETVGRLFRSIDRFWWAAGYVAEARQWAEEVLARGPALPAVTRARACFIAGSCAMLQGEGGGELLAEGHQLGLKAADAWSAGFSALCEGAVLAPMRGDMAGAMALVQEALALLREAGDFWGVEMSLGALSSMVLFGGHSDEAERHAEEHLRLATAREDLLSMTQAWDELALIALVRQDLDRAVECLNREIPLALQVGQPEHLASGLSDLGVVAAHGQPERAARCFAAADALRKAHGLAVIPTRRMLYDPALAAVRVALSPGAFDAAWRDGKAMTREQAVAFALEQNSSPGRSSMPAPMTSSSTGHA